MLNKLINKFNFKINSKKKINIFNKNVFNNGKNNKRN